MQICRRVWSENLEPTAFDSSTARTVANQSTIERHLASARVRSSCSRVCRSLYTASSGAVVTVGEFGGADYTNVPDSTQLNWRRRRWSDNRFRGSKSTRRVVSHPTPLPVPCATGRTASVAPCALARSCICCGVCLVFTHRRSLSSQLQRSRSPSRSQQASGHRAQHLSLSLRLTSNINVSN